MEFKSIILTHIHVIIIFMQLAKEYKMRKVHNQKIQAQERSIGQILSINLKGKMTDQVQFLELKGCKLKDFQQTFNQENFPKLQQLDLSNNEISSVEMIGFLPNLKILILKSNKIETLHYGDDITVAKGLNGCQNLSVLDLSSNLLKNFDGLHLCRLEKLRMLKASNNLITNIDGLGNLKQLSELDVNQNKIVEIGEIGEYLKIKCLKIDSNSLKNFTGILKLQRLQHLFANSNKITEFQDIQKLTQLQFLKQLELMGNILYHKAGYRLMMIKKIPGLLYLDGIVIHLIIIVNNQSIALIAYKYETYLQQYHSQFSKRLVNPQVLHVSNFVFYKNEASLQNRKDGRSPPKKR